MLFRIPRLYHFRVAHDIIGSVWTEYERTVLLCDVDVVSTSATLYRRGRKKHSDFFPGRYFRPWDTKSNLMSSLSYIYMLLIDHWLTLNRSDIYVFSCHILLYRLGRFCTAVLLVIGIKIRKYEKCCYIRIEDYLLN